MCIRDRYQDGYHPFQGLTFEDYECWEIIYNQNPFFKYKKQLKFLPTNLIDTNLMPTQRNDDMLLEEAYDNVISVSYTHLVSILSLSLVTGQYTVSTRTLSAYTSSAL